MKKTNVLIVDDNVSVRDILATYVELKGYNPMVRKNYDFVLSKLMEETLLAGFFDYECPPNDAPEWFENNGVFIPQERRILMSGGNKYESSGIEGYLLRKPFIPGTVNDLLNEIIRLGD